MPFMLRVVMVHAGGGGEEEGVVVGELIGLIGKGGWSDMVVGVGSSGGNI
jgi:hypothetical protein